MDARAAAAVDAAGVAEAVAEAAAAAAAHAAAAGARAASARADDLAERVRHQVAVLRAVAGTPYRGPAADVLRAQLADVAARSGVAAQHLDAAAGALAGQAARLTARAHGGGR